MTTTRRGYLHHGIYVGGGNVESFTTAVLGEHHPYGPDPWRALIPTVQTRRVWRAGSHDRSDVETIPLDRNFLTMRLAILF
jgi:hypothetical protein